MHDRMVCRRVLTHQVHCLPVFLSGIAIQTEPRESTQVLVTARQRSLRDCAVRAAHSAPGSATPAVTQQGNIPACRTSELLVGKWKRKHAELDEMVSRSARAELPPGCVLPLARNPRDV